MSGLCLEARDNSPSSALSPHVICAFSTQRFTSERPCVTGKTKRPICRSLHTSPRTTCKAVCVASPLTLFKPSFGVFGLARFGLGQTRAHTSALSADKAFRALVPSCLSGRGRKTGFPIRRVLRQNSQGRSVVAGARRELLILLTVASVISHVKGNPEMI